MALKALMEGKITAAQMKQFVGGAKEHDVVGSLIDTTRAGEPVNLGPSRCNARTPSKYSKRIALLSILSERSKLLRR